MSTTQLSPNEDYPIFHGIINHLDTGTYFVRVVIYDTNFNVLDTVDLEDKGSQNFLKIWKVPYDNVFQRGKHIIMVTSTYTDSGYTAKSENYGDEFDTFLVQERWNLSTMASIGGGGDGISPKKLKEIIRDEIKQIEPPKEQKELDTKALVKNITESVISSLPAFPEIKEVDFTDLKRAITSLDVGLNTEFGEVNQNIKKIGSSLPKEVMKLTEPKMEKLNKDLNHFTETMETEFKSSTKEASNSMKGTVEDFKEALPEILSNALDNKDLSLSLNLQPKEKEKEDPNIKRLKAKHNIK